jgi:Flp pilus assembly protein TadD
MNDALRFLTQERVNYPQHASFLYQAQAEILKRMGNKKAALSLLNEAVKNLPDDPEILYSEILLLDPFENRDILDKALKQLLNLEPNNPAYLNAYAYTLALQNRRLDEARRYAEHALEYAPDQASILDTLGYITFLQNDFDAASNILSKAYSLSHSINIGIRYAKSLYMQGALPQFNEVLQQLKQNHPNDPQLNQLDSLILPQHIKKS